MSLQAVQERIKHSPMTGFQMMIVGIGVMISMTDGVDILAASFVSPIISREWGLGPDRLGMLLSALANSLGVLVFLRFAPWRPSFW